MRRSLPPDVRESIGANVRALRERRQLTQQGLAEALGLEPQYVQQIEYGLVTVSLPVFLALGDALHVDPMSLLRPTKRLRRAPGRPAREQPSAGSRRL